ncbi:PfkB family carbohydrate kinase [Homoserinibacter gongjuensis]|uniref:Carbohydrate kinase PfkB domain-containing protein n=1 Tax=Homoserinibacter gongjuensis TaxID=1162968 RepID=A0ABQ6JPQ0_9MICO|nr:PfkB family carbohydrate kinase [Homoserinibacter gongjuensis]GMA90223.1 hypothetical protein GCM10025869_07520 [Homoserinibacter gongjuensis]
MGAAALVVGETLIDVVHAEGDQPTEKVGGSATNTAVALRRLGRDVLMATSFGRDERGPRSPSSWKPNASRWPWIPM